MISSDLIVVIISLGGCYVSFYQPMLLSKNIDLLSKAWVKNAFSVGCLLVAIIQLQVFNLESAVEWIDYFFALALLFIACIDGYSKIIPNKLLALGALLASAKLIIVFDPSSVFACITVIGVSVVLYYVGSLFTSKNYLGWGDVKLVAVIALFTGWEFVMVLYVGVVLAGLFALIGVLSKRLERASKISLAPFMYISYMALAFGTHEKLGSFVEFSLF